MIKLTKRQLAARFVDAIGTVPTTQLTAAVVDLATDAGYDQEDLQSLVAAVEQELQARFGAAEVQLTTAHELPAAALEELAAKVAAIAGLQSFTYTNRVDASLLGGFDATVGDLAVHHSIRERLAGLEVARG